MSIQPSLSPWSYKPWWCQPWSILLTGATLIGISWLLTKTLWLTLVVSMPVLLWMGYFLLIWPRLMMSSSLQEGDQQQAPDSVSDLKN